MSEDVKEARKSTDLFEYHSCVLHILETRDKANILTREASIDPRPIYRKSTPISVPSCCHIHQALHNTRTIRAIQATKRMSQCKKPKEPSNIDASRRCPGILDSNGPIAEICGCWTLTFQLEA